MILLAQGLAQGIGVHRAGWGAVSGGGDGVGQPIAGGGRRRRPRWARPGQGAPPRARRSQPSTLVGEGRPGDARWDGPDIGQAGQVEHPVTPSKCGRRRSKWVTSTRSTWRAGWFRKPARFSSRRGKVVQDPHPVAVAEQALHQMAADEALLFASDEGLSGHGQPFQIAYRGGKPKPLA